MTSLEYAAWIVRVTNRYPLARMRAVVCGPLDELDERVNGDPDGGAGEEAEISFDAEDDGDDTDSEW